MIRLLETNFSVKSFTQFYTIQMLKNSNDWGNFLISRYLKSE